MICSYLWNHDKNKQNRTYHNQAVKLLNVECVDGCGESLAANACKYLNQTHQTDSLGLISYHERPTEINTKLAWNIFLRQSIT